MHTLYAIFDSPQACDAAIRDLESIGTLDSPEHPCRLVVHKKGLEGEPASEMNLFETAAASTLARGTLLGALGGAVLFGLVVYLATGLSAGAILGAIGGAITGLLVGALAGPSDIDPAYKAMAKEIELGKVLLAVEPASRRCEDRAQVILERHGGHVMHRHVVRPMTRREHAAMHGAA